MWFKRRKRSRVQTTPEKRDPIAQDIRVKGITRPLRQQQTEQHITASVRHDRLERIISAFVNTRTWDAAHEVLVRESALLLTNDAVVALSELIRQVKNDPSFGTQRVVELLVLHRTLLERAIEIGLDPAWQEFRAKYVQDAEEPRTDDVPLTEHITDHESEIRATLNTLKAFLNTDRWSETREMLLHERERLTSDLADRVLGELIEAARADSAPQARDSQHYLELHRTLLRETREMGVEAAWEHFDRLRRDFEAEIAQRRQESAASERYTPEVTRVLRDFLSTSSWSETRAILEREFALLTSPEADHLLGDLITAAHNDADPRATQGEHYLQLHRQLLQRARETGIERAWAEFVKWLEGSAPDATNRPLPDSPEATPQSIPLGPLPPIAPDEEVDQAKTIAVVGQFLEANSWEEAKAILEKYQDVLLTNAAAALIRARAEVLRRTGESRNAYGVRLLELQARLLTRAREVGIAQAWAEFEAAR
jgi:hypothetical protein